MSTHVYEKPFFTFLTNINKRHEKDKREWFAATNCFPMYFLFQLHTFVHLVALELVVGTTIYLRAKAIEPVSWMGSRRRKLMLHPKKTSCLIDIDLAGYQR